MKFTREILSNYSEANKREFLLTNGIGGSSSSSLSGNNFRRYHSLLTASLKPPLNRMMIVQKICEKFDGISLKCEKKIDNNKILLDEGNKYLKSFSKNNFVEFEYMCSDADIKKEQFMIYQKNASVVKYTFDSIIKEQLLSEIDIFLNYRDIHHLGADVIGSHYFFKIISDYKIEFYYKNRKILNLYSNTKIIYTNVNEIVSGLYYENEFNDRGEQYLDNSYFAGKISFIFNKKTPVYIIYSYDELESIDFKFIEEKEIKRIEQIRKNVKSSDEFLMDLAVAADNFIVKRDSSKGKTVLAGYPWFSDWGRDTMISLSGLTLATGRIKDCELILKTFVDNISEGMVPNKFPDWDGEPLMYNTIDASLWLFFAVQNYIKFTKNYKFVEENLFMKLEEIIHYYYKGTRYGISCDKVDGMVMGGDKNSQLTWMDVKYKEWAVTPRYGKAVEINALWYNALKFMIKLSKKFNKKYEFYEELSKLVNKNFTKLFYNENNGMLYDYITEKEKNTDIRPNQLIAISLPYTALSKKVRKNIIKGIISNLYTPYGLKSLDSNNNKYVGIYKGNIFERDASYHQGTVWGWFNGHLLSVVNKEFGKDYFMKYLSEFKTHFYFEGCINNYSEIFDGDAPYTARGCFAQAWSIGELLRVLKEVENEKINY